MTPLIRKRWRAVACAAAVTLLTPAAVALAQTNTAKPAEHPPSTYDKVWAKFTNWYDDTSNPAIQRVLFTGRFQHDLALVEGDEGDARESNVRRVRFGPRITFFHDYLLHAEVEINPQEHNPFYVRFTDAYVAWQKNPKSVVMAGKQSVPFTQEGATSSKELLTIDRSNLANNIWFTQEYMPGVSLSGRVAPWNYRAGVYSSGAANREFGEFNGGLFTLALLGYDFAKKLDVKEATLTGNYLYQRPDVNNTFTKRFEHIMSAHMKVEDTRWGVRGDVSKTVGYLGQHAILGMMAMPYYNFTDKFQAVVRYTFLDSDGPNGLSLNTYENRAARGNGDRYSETYLGVNYFIYGHKLKLQTGVHFADMRDQANDGGAFSGVSWTTGLRIGW
jgi:phosphate-selective porin OprO and OprP